MTRSKLIGVFSFVMLFSTVAHVTWAAWDNGGGDVFVCQERAYLGLVSQENIYLADTYDYLHSKEGRNLVSQFRKLSALQILEAVVKTVRFQDATLGEELFQALANLKFTERTTVPELNDDDIQNVPQGCEKKQLAIQGIRSGAVIYSRPYFNRLSEVEKALFHLHESFVRITGQATRPDLMRNTKEIREKVSSVGSSQTFFDFLSSLNLNRTWFVKWNPGSPTKIAKDALSALRENDYGSFYLATTEKAVVSRWVKEEAGVRLEKVGDLREGNNLNLVIFKKVQDVLSGYADLKVGTPTLFWVYKDENGRHRSRYFELPIQSADQAVLTLAVGCRSEFGSGFSSEPTDSEHGWNCFVDSVWLP
ncbi:MAG: hypothetical protein HYY62_06345 [Deltaproteobacteria bacterium]|nr:hypothetical protein [Deltaproteobacteria bacterium]